MIKSNLKEKLELQGLSIREFARKIDYRFDTVRLLYRGETTRIPVALLDRACRELNCNVGDLLTHIDDEEVESEGDNEDKFSED